jgi:hypothetical protein
MEAKFRMFVADIFTVEKTWNLFFAIFILFYCQTSFTQVLLTKAYTPGVNPIEVLVYNPGNKYVIIDSTGYVSIYNMSDFSLRKKIALQTGIPLCNEECTIATIDSSLGKLYVLGSTGTSVIDLNGESIISTLPISSNGYCTVLRGKFVLNQGKHYLYDCGAATGGTAVLYMVNTISDQIDSFNVNNLSIVHDIALNPITNKVYICGISGGISVFDGNNKSFSTIPNMPNSYVCEVNYVENKLYLTETTFTQYVIDLNTNNVKMLSHNDAQYYRFDPMHNRTFSDAEINCQISVFDGKSDTCRIIQRFGYGYQNYGIVYASGHVYISQRTKIAVIDSIYLRNYIQNMPSFGIVNIDQANKKVIVAFRDSVYLFNDSLVPPPIKEPSLLTPQKDSFIDSIDIDLSWTPVVGAYNYYINLCRDSTNDIFTNGCTSILSSTNSYNTTEWDTGSFYWCVYARLGVIGNDYYTPWSEIRKFVRINKLLAPTLVSPSNNIINQPISLSLTWNEVSGASTYRVQLSTSSSFSSTVVDDSTLTLGTKAVGPLSTNTTYYWRVNAKNAGGTSAWSDVWSFTTVPPAAGAPTLSSPSNSATNQPLSLSLTWNTVSGASTYRVQLSTISSFTSTVVDDSTLTSSIEAVGPLSTSTTYYWRVNVKNAGGTSAWSEVWSFTTVPPAAGAPTLSSPSNSATNQPLSLSLMWNTVSGTSNYHVQLSTSPSFSSTVVNDSTLMTTTKDVGPLSTSTTYYWRVNAKNPGGTSAWSEVWSFTTIPPAPGTPTLASPSNNATNQPLSLSLTWNTVSGASTYRVQLSTSSSFSGTVVDDSTLTSVSKAIGPVSTSMTYYWHVNAKNAGGTSAWSEAWSFTTIPPVPNQVSLVSPSNAAVITIDSVFLIWNKSSPGVDRYCLELFTDSLMSSRILIDSTTTDSLKIQKNLQNKTTYWWRVKAHNIAGWGIFSDSRKFSIDIPVVSVLPKKYSCILSGMSKSGSFIKYGLPTASNVSIKLYSIQGKLLKSIFNSTQQPGYYQIPFGIPELSNGYFILSFKAGSFSMIKRISNF